MKTSNKFSAISPLSLLLFSLLCLPLQAQFSDGYWQVGTIFFASRYWLYNSDDWNRDISPAFLFKPLFPNPAIKPNGLRGGVFAGYYWGKHFGLEAGLSYSSQRQDYEVIYIPLPWRRDLSSEMSSRLNYLSLPFSFVLATNDEYKQQGFVSIGIEPAFLTGFREVIISYAGDAYPPGSRQEAVISGHTLTSSRNFGDSLNTTQEINRFDIDYIYQRFDINLNLTFGIRHTFSDVFGVSLAVRGSLGLLEPENREARIRNKDGTTDLWWDTPKFVESSVRLPNRPRTYQIHVGLELKAFYTINR